jgi:hypothetical protein
MDTDTMISLVAFTLLTLLWLAFGIVLLTRRGLLDETWRRFRGMPLLGQRLITLLVLPVVVGPWIWQRSWPIWVRLVLVAGVAWATMYTFFPRTLFA